MTSADLSPQQARKLMAIVARELRLLNRLCDRMRRRGFAGNDPLWRAAQAARNTMQDLHVAAHYAAFGRGVGTR